MISSPPKDGLKKPRSKKQKEAQAQFEVWDPAKASPETRRLARKARREWKRIHSKAGRRVDKAACRDSGDGED